MKILNALSLGPNGIQIRKGSRFTVALLYSPLVVGVGRTIEEAAEDCKNWLFDVAKDHPHYWNDLYSVFSALEDK